MIKSSLFDLTLQSSCYWQGQAEVTISCVGSRYMNDSILVIHSLRINEKKNFKKSPVIVSLVLWCVIFVKSTYKSLFFNLYFQLKNILKSFRSPVQCPVFVLVDIYIVLVVLESLILLFPACPLTWEVVVSPPVCLQLSSSPTVQSSPSRPRYLSREGS